MFQNSLRVSLNVKIYFIVNTLCVFFNFYIFLLRKVEEGMIVNAGPFRRGILLHEHTPIHVQKSFEV